MLGTLDTILLSWFFTKDFSIALTIGGIEIVTKTLLYYLHERIWQKVRWGKHNFEEKPYRSLSKGILWRVLGSLDTSIISFFVTGKPGIAGSIGLTEFVTKTILYYLHERVWMRISWGKKPS